MALKQGEHPLPWSTHSQSDAAPSLHTQADRPREANSTEWLGSGANSSLRKQSLARHLPNLRSAQKENQCSGWSNPLSFLGLSFHFCKMEGGRNSGHLITKFPSRTESIAFHQWFPFCRGKGFVLFYDIKKKKGGHSYLRFLPEPRLPEFKSPTLPVALWLQGKLLYLSVLWISHQ